jgi:2-(1,2-epoxy-1,2-dihydrophenyl)acetyl-CoA isomerase
MMSSKKHLTPSKHKLQPSVILEVQGGGIAEVILNRPEALNALNEDLAQELVAALHECEHDSAIRCVVLRANGPAFMVGGDIRFFKEKIQEAYHQKETLQEAHRQKDLRQDIFQKLVQRIHPAIESIRRMPKPVVASVHGATAGFGVSLMAACDLAIAAHSSSFTLAYSNIGLSPDGGASYFLVRNLG